MALTCIRQHTGAVPVLVGGVVPGIMGGHDPSAPFNLPCVSLLLAGLRDTTISPFEVAGHGLPFTAEQWRALKGMGTDRGGGGAGKSGCQLFGGEGGGGDRAPQNWAGSGGFGKRGMRGAPKPGNMTSAAQPTPRSGLPCGALHANGCDTPVRHPRGCP